MQSNLNDQGNKSGQLFIYIHYEALKDSLFQLLAEDKPIIEQIFDREAGSLQFRRVNA